MSERGWSDLHNRWARICPPMRPHPQAVAAVMDALAPFPGPCLLLGVTPELALARNAPVTAIDWSAEMIAQVWPGNGGQRNVIRADWVDLPVTQGSLACAMGDGALNMLSWPDDYARLGARLADAIRPGGRWVLRCFVSPDRPESFDSLANAILSGGSAFHAFKWRLAMAVCQNGGAANVAMQQVFAQFEALFPDRQRLSAATGWTLDTIAEIDDYRTSPLSMSFPTRSELLEVFPEATLCESGSYELAERCPLLVMDL